MKFNAIVILLAGLSAFASIVSAQAPASVSEGEALVVTEGQPTVATSNLFLAEQFNAEQLRPQPPPPAALIQSDVNNLRATEGRYRAEVKLLAENERQFVHCKLKNGKVLTGRLSDAGDVKFAVRTNALGGVGRIQRPRRVTACRARRGYSYQAGSPDGWLFGLCHCVFHSSCSCGDNPQLLSE